jgi:exodeoxyribonuclease V alpha subunit
MNKFVMKRYEFDNGEYNFQKQKANSEWNFYRPSSCMAENISLAIKGYDLKLTDKIIVHGSETENHYGKTIWIQSQEIDVDSKEYNICVLSEVKGITPEKAEEIFEQSSVKTLQDLIDYLSGNKIKGIGEKTKARIIEKLTEVQKDDLFSKLHLLLGNVRYARKISEKIQNLDEIYRNPYKVMKSLNIGFSRIDEIAIQKLGIELDNTERCCYLVEYKFNEFNKKQSNYILLDEFKEYLINEVKYLATDIDTFLHDNELIVVDGNKVYLAPVYEAEKETPDLLFGNFKMNFEINEMHRYLDLMQEKNTFKLSENQKESIISILKSDKVNILTGEAGTGKSTITRYLCDIISKKYSTLLLSPTGKAAGRMRECTDRNAYTIHSFLYFITGDFSNSYMAYEKFGISDKIVLVIDEFSMVDQVLFYQLLQGIYDCNFIDLVSVILIGDPYQLPSVGCGQVLVDMINSKVFNHVHLTETFRQLSDSNIIKNSKKVRNKKMIDVIKTLDFWVDQLSPNNIKKFFYHFKTKYKDNLLNLYKNVQFVTARNVTKDEINDMFKIPKTEENKFNFEVGDKVINTENNREIGISNGDFGIVEYITKKEITIYFYDIDIRHTFQKGEVSKIQLGYACTTHKLQGSEYKTIVIILENNQAISNYRSFYTAITRGKENVIILANSQKDILEVCQRDNDYLRKTDFVNRLKNLFANSYKEKNV